MSEPQKHSIIVKRLKPGDDLRDALERIVQDHQIKAGVLISLVGSLRSAALRTPSGAVKLLSTPLEIVSCTGTVGSAGIHVHISVSDENGATLGGHLMKDCLIRTTVELAIHDLSDLMIFDRELDDDTGYKELIVREQNLE